MNDIMMRMIDFFLILFFYHLYHSIIHIISLLLALKTFTKIYSTDLL
jgi:hypothetical protein